MRPFLSNFDDRKNEIHQYFNFLQFIEKYIAQKGNVLSIDNESLSFNQNLVKVLKANCYMMLYNLVEGSITEAIDAIFDAISTQQVHFKDLTHDYKKIWLNYQQGIVKITTESSNKKEVKDHAKNRVNRTLSDVLNHLEYFRILTFTDQQQNSFDNYKGYLKVVSTAEISGNIDAAKMRELAKTYGFSVPERCNDMLKIKNIRNQLAHGELSFAEAGVILLEELIDMKKNVFVYLEAILLNINDFIENEGFKT
jgi:hypothetical protein